MRFTLGRFLAVYYGAIVIFAVVCLVFGLTPRIPGWVMVVATCAPIVLILFREA